MNPRHWVIRWVTPFIWRIFPGRKLKSLQQFSLVEKDSGCQLLYCLSLVRDEKLKAYLFQHVLEEFYHSELFEDLSRELSPGHLYQQLLPRLELLQADSGNAELLDFFAYVHEGERAVNRDFLVYSNAPLEPTLKQVFRRAGLDEGHHEKDTDEIVSREFGGAAAHRWSRFKAALKRHWELFKSGSKAFGTIPMTIVISLIYFLLGGFVARAAQRRLALSNAEQLRLFSAQAHDFKEGHS